MQLIKSLENTRNSLQSTFEAKKAAWLLSFFYFVGILGLSFSFSYSFYTQLTPLALLLSIFLLIIYHRPNFNLPQLFSFLAIFLGGFFVEMIGVNTGLIFGNYIYSNGLGFKVLGTPLMIGINWLMLSYIVYDILQKLNSRLLRLFLGATVLLIYDLLLEQLAAYLDMWFWDENIIPLQNYVAWFVIGFVFQAVFMLSKIKYSNSLSWPVLIVQLAFFAILYLIQLF